jgi:hypothetical protein
MEWHAMGFASRGLAGPLAAAILLTGAAPHDADLAAIAAAAGHPARRHLHAERSFVRDNRTFAETLDADGPRRLERLCLGTICRGSWNDGRSVRSFGLNGIPLPDRALDAPLARSLAAIETLAFAESGFEGTVRPLPATGGLRRWLVDAPGGRPLVVDVDRTDRPVAVEDGDERRPLVASAAPDGTLLFADRAYPTVAISAEPLGPPPGARTTPGPARDLPLAPGPLPIVPCLVDGTAARCLLDSGTTPSAVSLAFAERLGREPEGEIAISALGEYLTGAIATQTLDLGAQRLDGLRLAVLPTERGLGFDVVVGADALAGLRLTFDAARGTVRIEPGGGPFDGATIEFGDRDGVPVVDAVLAGRAPVTLLLDTGDDGLVTVGYALFQHDPALLTPHGNARREGFGGSTTALAGELASLTVGSVTFTHVPVAAVRGLAAGHLGYALAARCAPLTIDFAEQRLACGAR